MQSSILNNVRDKASKPPLKTQNAHRLRFDKAKVNDHLALVSIGIKTSSILDKASNNPVDGATPSPIMPDLHRHYHGSLLISLLRTFAQ